MVAETVVRVLERECIARSLTDYLSREILHEKRVLTEGYYCGDWLDSECHTMNLYVPEDALLLGRSLRTKAGIVPFMGFDALSLVGQVDGDGQYMSLLHVVEETDHVYPYRSYLSGVRTILVEDGRVFHRKDLLAETNGNQRILPAFLDFVKREGFDKVYERFRV